MNIHNGEKERSADPYDGHHQMTASINWLVGWMAGWLAVWFDCTLTQIIDSIEGNFENLF